MLGEDKLHLGHSLRSMGGFRLWGFVVWGIASGPNHNLSSSVGNLGHVWGKKSRDNLKG